MSDRPVRTFSELAEQALDDAVTLSEEEWSARVAAGAAWREEQDTARELLTQVGAAVDYDPGTGTFTDVETGALHIEP